MCSCSCDVCEPRQFQMLEPLELEHEVEDAPFPGPSLTLIQFLELCKGTFYHIHSGGYEPVQGLPIHRTVVLYHSGNSDTARIFSPSIFLHFFSTGPAWSSIQNAMQEFRLGEIWAHVWLAPHLVERALCLVQQQISSCVAHWDDMVPWHFSMVNPLFTTLMGGHTYLSRPFSSLKECIIFMLWCTPHVWRVDHKYSLVSYILIPVDHWPTKCHHQIFLAQFNSRKPYSSLKYQP